MKIVDRLGRAIVGHMVGGIDMSECQEADTLEALSESEVESLEDLQAEFARLREAVVAQHDPTDSLSRLHLQQCLARLSEAEHWAERIVLE